MRKKKFSLTKIICGTALLMSGSVMGQRHHIPLPVTSGFTHCVTNYEDCLTTNLAEIEANFELHIADFAGSGDYRTVTKLYKGDFVNVGMGKEMINEVLVDTKISTPDVTFGLMPIGGLTDMYTSTFWSTTPVLFYVNLNGWYRATTTLQVLNTGTSAYDDVYTTPLSSVYLTIDMPPYTTFGDLAEVAEVSSLKIGGNFGFSINGDTTNFINYTTCSASPLMLTNVANWYGNSGTAKITVEQGSINSITHVFTPISGTPPFITFTSDGQDKDLSALFSLSSYSGGLRIKYELPNDNCLGTTTPVSKTMTVSVVTAAFLNDYKQRNGSAYCGQQLSKNTANTWNIVAAMPAAGTGLPDFKCNVASTIGWAGATSVGITNLNFVGDNYSVDVYEVNSSTGARNGSPSIYLNSGIANVSTDLPFNENGFGAGFNISAPYYVDGTADATGTNGAGDYFTNFYLAALDPLSGVTLAQMSAKVFCVEVSQFPSGCVVNKKSYFKIANNGILNGKGARFANSQNEESEIEYISLDIFPNPTQGELNIPISDEDTNVSMIIIDNLGKQVLSISDVKAKNGNINIEQLSAGIYFYTINKDNSLYRGKIVKQ